MKTVLLLEEALDQFKNEGSDVIQKEMDSLWAGDECQANINLRRYCRKSGFEPSAQIIVNRRYKRLTDSFKYFSQRLRVVGMSYQRTIFAHGFLNNGDVDENYVKRSFENTHRWLFDDSYYLLIHPEYQGETKSETLREAREKANDGIVGKKVLFFFDEIKENLDNDLTLNKYQKQLFLFYFNKHHRKLRRFFTFLYSSFFWALFVFLICLWSTLTQVFDFVYDYILTPISLDKLEEKMSDAVAEYAHVIMVFLVFFVVALIALFIARLIRSCWVSFIMAADRIKYMK